jgi:hypothetical protein
VDNRQVFGVLGSLLLAFGVFTPLVSIPIMGNMTYFQNGRGDGTIVLILAVISLGLTLAKKYRALWLTAAACTGMMLFTFTRFYSAMDEMKKSMDTSLSGNPFRGLADMAMQSVQMQWGWGVLVAGVALLCVAAAVKPSDA